MRANINPNPRQSASHKSAYCWSSAAKKIPFFSRTTPKIPYAGYLRIFSLQVTLILFYEVVSIQNEVKSQDEERKEERMKKNIILVTMFLFVFGGTTAWGAVGGSDVPIGAVLDWWRGDTTTPVPDGYMICDGSTVLDSSSPLYNKTLPNLAKTFIMGVTDVSEIGASGGASSHGHKVDVNHTHGTINTYYSGLHGHNIDVPAFNYTGYSNYAGSHNHTWLRFQVNPDGKKLHVAFNSNGTEYINTLWSNGIDNAGSGNYPFAQHGSTVSTRNFYTKWNGNHRHQQSLAHNHGAFTSASSGNHYHRLYVPSLGTLYKGSTTASSLPPYYGLLKIMRIK